MTQIDSADEGGEGLDPERLSRVTPRPLAPAGAQGQRDYIEEKWTGPPCIPDCLSQQLGPSPVAKCLVPALQSSCCLWHVRDLSRRAGLFSLPLGMAKQPIAGWRNQLWVHCGHSGDILRFPDPRWLRDRYDLFIKQLVPIPLPAHTHPPTH